MPPVAPVWDFPFRLGPGGSVAVVEQDSDRDIENCLAAAIYTRPGERIQAPSFGIADPAFVGWEAPALARHVLDFGPTVDVTSVVVARRGGDSRGDREEVSVTWARQS
jgi:hypothetical protein